MFIVMQSDFGDQWPFVSTIKGVCKQIDATLEIIDSCHTIEKFNILQASQQLNYIEPYWNKNTVFLSVVDPGVGTNRKACVALLNNGNYVVTPDNGTLTHLYYEDKIKAIREIDKTKYCLQEHERVSVFDGRNIFAYVAAQLGSGRISFDDVGMLYSINDIVLLDYQYIKAHIKSDKVQGIVANVSDPFGSIVFNILTEDFIKFGYQEGQFVHVILENESGIYFDDTVMYAKSFGFVDIGKPVLFNSSSNYISLGFNQDDFQNKYQVKAGLTWKVYIEKAR